MVEGREMEVWHFSPGELKAVYIVDWEVIDNPLYFQIHNGAAKKS